MRMLTVAHQAAGLTKTEIKAVAFDALRFLICGLYASLIVLSTDLVRAYKPDPRAYQMAIDAFRLQGDEIAFAAFAGWDGQARKRSGIRPCGSTARTSPRRNSV